MSYTVSLQHIDTCLPCYLQDHHNRDGELLLGVYVDKGTRLYSVKDELNSEISQLWRDDMPDSEEFSNAVDRAVNEAFAGCNMLKCFDKSLESRTNCEDLGGDEYVQAWFLLTWELDE